MGFWWWKLIMQCWLKTEFQNFRQEAKLLEFQAHWRAWWGPELAAQVFLDFHLEAFPGPAVAGLSL